MNAMQTPRTADRQNQQEVLRREHFSTWEIWGRFMEEVTGEPGGFPGCELQDGRLPH